MLHYISLFCVLVLHVQVQGSKDLPNYIQNLKCPLDKDFEKCFIRSGNLAIPLVARGDPDYHIPKMNPLEIPFLNLISSSTFNLNLTNVKVYGLENLRIEGIRFSMEKGLFTMILKCNNITLHGEYTANGKILVMPIKGSGPFSILLSDGKYKFSNVATKYIKDGEEYYEPKDGRLDYFFGKIVFNFDNLFGGDKVLGNQVNSFLNDNWDLLVVDFAPGISKTITYYIMNIFKKFCTVVPAKNFFL